MTLPVPEDGNIHLSFRVQDHVDKLIIKQTMMKAISLSLELPTCIILGEEIVLEIVLFNNLQQDMEVFVVLEHSELFEFIVEDIDVNSRTVLAGGQSSATVLFPIRPITVGEIAVSVEATALAGFDQFVGKIHVKPEGVAQLISQTLFLEVPPTERSLSRRIQLSLPAGLVPDSQRAHVSVFGDILGPSIAGLENLVQMPTGCGEQNMIHFAPNVYLLKYLSTLSQTYEDLQRKALAFIREGYQRELSYLREDGSFSAFGERDSSGSTWLTAFVVRCFLQARPFMQIDQGVISKAMSWLVSQQTPQGSFTEPGTVIHTQLQGGLNGNVSLTAYVLIALLEDQFHKDMFQDSTSKAQEFLEEMLWSGISSNYTLCLVAYALSLANSPRAPTALTELRRVAESTDGVISWTTSDSDLADSWQAASTSIEMASYVLLTLFKQANIVEGIALMKWLSRQRSHLGGFGSTQDTVIALQALSLFAAFSGSQAINLTIGATFTTSHIEANFTINSTNYLLHQSQEVETGKEISVDIFVEGRGFALFQGEGQ
ncbi:CD109 antigen-like [Chanos chanos]|uniref:CD109 antigen-like n=1 Tax=Chanos chanos TaxID=29144 RepID=A0A6J2ULI8_CHACN|nr:CD109 antigen-like [Chanos chanos]